MERETTADDALSIGDLARETGASVRSLRHYEMRGLLASKRQANGYRVFSPSSVTQVRQIQRLLAAGFNLAEIRAFPDCMRLTEGAGACPQTIDTQRRRLAQIERQIDELKSRRVRLRDMLAGTVGAASKGSRAVRLR